jgi:type III pantothenate kinase
MLLLLDVGNSNVTIGLARAGRLVASRRAETRRAATPDELEAQLEALLRLDDAALADVEAIAMSSVVPSVGAAIETIAARRERPLVVASAGTVPLAIRTERAAEVGADRLVNALAAARLHGTPAVVADFGTATTVDAVAADGAYVGGAIAPGLVLGLTALSSGTALLPRVELRTPDRAIARDTVASIQAGTILGYQALATGLIRRVRDELAEAADVAPSDVIVVATGGLSREQWLDGVAGITVVDPDLTLAGLMILHAEVAGGEPLELGFG